ncbi:MAG: hypothetical protein MK213_02470 [Planctomycetes bacterium]|nr:hypothetical protein [Planctomycetota bacterium]
MSDADRPKARSPKPFLLGEAAVGSAFNFGAKAEGTQTGRRDHLDLGVLALRVAWGDSQKNGTPQTTS